MVWNVTIIRKWLAERYQTLGYVLLSAVNYKSVYIASEHGDLNLMSGTCLQEPTISSIVSNVSNQHEQR